MAHQIEHAEPSKVLLFLSAIAVLLAAAARYILQPLLAAWLFFTLNREKARVRELVTDVFRDDLAELVKSATEIRQCQAEQGERLSFIAGSLGLKE